jgi:hypothetical protein
MKVEMLICRKMKTMDGALISTLTKWAKKKMTILLGKLEELLLSSLNQ